VKLSALFGVGVKTMEIADKPFLLPNWAKVVLIGRRPKFTVIRIAIVVVASLAVFPMMLRPVKIKGASMSPTYNDGSINFINRLSYTFHDPARGDVVGIRMAGESVMFMKRIIALPGETIEFRDGHAYVDGESLDEPYLKYPCAWNTPPVKLGPEGYYFIGDNRSMPREDHVGGEREKGRIVGKVLL
jgi:signal peptidase I